MAKNKSETNLATEIGKQSAFASLQQETFLNLVRTHGQLSIDFGQLFKNHGVSDVQYNALRILKGANRPMQIYEIADRMLTHQPDISRLISRLDTAGFVSRDKCTEDGRVVWIKLTPRGRAVLKKLAKPIEAMHLAQFEKLTERELATLNKLLLKARQ